MGKGKKKTPQKSTAKKVNPARTKTGRIPQGRTLTTHDQYLRAERQTGSNKKRPVVVIESDEKNRLAVVPLSSRAGRNRTRLKNYQSGKSYYKHFVETEDDEGRPIKVNRKFAENHPNMDVSKNDVKKIRDKVFNHSQQSSRNQEKIKAFRDKKNPRN